MSLQFFKLHQLVIVGPGHPVADAMKLADCFFNPPFMQHAKIWLPAGYLEWPEGNVVTRIPVLNVFWLSDHFQGDYLVLGMFGECSYAGFQGYGWIWLHQTLHKTCTGRTTTETIWRSIEVLFRMQGKKTTWLKLPANLFLEYNAKSIRSHR